MLLRIFSSSLTLFSGPETMNVKVPALAPDWPPETGQSWYVIPELSKTYWTWFTASMVIVEVSITVLHEVCLIFDSSITVWMTSPLSGRLKNRVLQDAAISSKDSQHRAFSGVFLSFMRDQRHEVCRQTLTSLLPWGPPCCPILQIQKFPGFPGFVCSFCLCSFRTSLANLKLSTSAGNPQ